MITLKPPAIFFNEDPPQINGMDYDNLPSVYPTDNYTAIQVPQGIQSRIIYGVPINPQNFTPLGTSSITINYNSIAYSFNSNKFFYTEGELHNYIIYLCFYILKITEKIDVLNIILSTSSMGYIVTSNNYYRIEASGIKFNNQLDTPTLLTVANITKTFTINSVGSYITDGSTININIQVDSVILNIINQKPALVIYDYPFKTVSLQKALLLNIFGTGGGGTGTITQQQFNALLGTSNLNSLVESYLRSKQYLIINNGGAINKYIGNYVTIELASDTNLNSGAIALTAGVFNTILSKSTNSALLVQNGTSNNWLNAGTYRISIRLQYTINSPTSPAVFFQLNNLSVITGNPNVENNSSTAFFVSQSKTTNNDANVLYAERIIRLDVLTEMFIHCYVSAGTTTLEGQQTQITIEKISD